MLLSSMRCDFSLGLIVARAAYLWGDCSWGVAGNYVLFVVFDATLSAAQATLIGDSLLCTCISMHFLYGLCYADVGSCCRSS